MKVMIVFWALWLIASVAAAATSHPQARTVAYRAADGESHVYALQEPPHVGADSSIFIYMHGSAGLEEQGMELFPSLRQLLAEKSWIYVCPRDEDYDGLRRELERRYGKCTLFLSGASAGGSSAFNEAIHNPGAYRGLILLCPTIFPEAITEKAALLLTMPVWIVAGERDDISVGTSRRLYQILSSKKRRVHYHEIPGGNHNAPLKKVQWVSAVTFLLEAR